jgi:hypothetical protein
VGTPRPGPDRRDRPPFPAAVKDPNTAVLLEILPGLFAFTFGIGHLYLGRTARGLLLMFGYWFVLFVNAVLLVFGIGLCTGTVCHLAMVAVSAIWAHNDAREMAELR